MENKSLYLAKIKPNEQMQETSLGVFNTLEDAWAAIQQVLRQNPQLSAKCVWVEEFSYKNKHFMLDIKD